MCPKPFLLRLCNHKHLYLVMEIFWRFMCLLRWKSPKDDATLKIAWVAWISCSNVLIWYDNGIFAVTSSRSVAAISSVPLLMLHVTAPAYFFFFVLVWRANSVNITSSRETLFTVLTLKVQDGILWKSFLTSLSTFSSFRKCQSPSSFWDFPT